MPRSPAPRRQGVLDIHPIDLTTNITISYHNTGIQAGFPSPADDYMESPIDLNQELIPHPVSTFMGRVRGDSMQDAGIFDGDLLVIDKSLKPKNGDVAVCFIDGEFTIKYIKIGPKSLWLVPANDKYSPIKITPENDFVIWGIVTYSIRKHRRV